MWSWEEGPTIVKEAIAVFDALSVSKGSISEKLLKNSSYCRYAWPTQYLFGLDK